MKIYQVKDGRWKITYYVGPKQRRLLGINKKQLIQQAEKERHEYIQKGITPDAYKSSITFGEACKKYWELYAVPNGQQSDKYSIDKFIRTLGASTRLSAINVERLKELKAEMLQEYVGSTFNRRWTLLTGIFREAIANGYISTNPCKLVKRQRGADTKRSRYLSTDEVELLLTKLPVEAGLFAEVALYTGFRLGNLQRLEWSDIDTKQGVVLAKKTKSGKPYSVPVNGPLLRAFQEQRQYGTTTHVFRKRSWGKIFRPIFHSLGWKDVSIHTFRHTFASLLVIKGEDIYKVKNYLGHSSITQTERYSHLSPKSLASGVHLLSFKRPNRAEEVINRALNEHSDKPS